MNQKYEKLKSLLKELFQLDQPDLDFGFYRVMHTKSAEVTQFLEKDLLPQIRDAFDQYKTADKAVIENELSTVIEGVKAAGMNPDDSPRVKELREQLKSDAVDISALESEVYDHLFSFFRRYYSEGDFLAKRVYKPDVYAIPYEGEEVTLHWANKDQYYIKTSEYLRDYSFRLRPEDEKNPMRVHFRLSDAAEGEHDNVKATEGKDRVFILVAPGESGHDFINEEDGKQGKELVIRFEYRSATLSDWSNDDRGGKKLPPNQKDLSDVANLRVLGTTDASLAKWVKELSVLDPTEKEPDRTLLKKHIKKYSDLNTFDYFIHRDLGTFLRRELDFYIKNEVLHLEDLENESIPRVEQYLSKIKVIRKIAVKIIEFLAQIEDFQKKLWLKKKFIVETQYCITVGCIPEAFYPEIVANEEQCEEWLLLYLFDEVNIDQATTKYCKKLNVEFLKKHPTLVVDTRNFQVGFTARLIEAIGDVDSQMDGLLIHGENFQALNLLQMRYQKQVSGIYIDPPYNTDATEIVYKNGYKDSSWCSLLRDRLALARRLLHSKGISCTTIDEREVSYLSILIDEIMSDYELRPVIIEYNHRGRVKSNFAITHEYALWAIPYGQDLITRQTEISDDIKRNLRRTGTDSTRESSPKQFYGIEVNQDTLEIVGVTEPLGLEDDIPMQGDSHTKLIWPIDDQGVERRWYYSSQRVLNESKAGTVWAKRIKGEIQIHYHQEGKPKLRKSVWVGKTMDASTYGSELLNDLFGMAHSSFSFPKSIHSVSECLQSITYDKKALYIDYFAGSGTTAHAVTNLNREDGGRRKYILVEMADYFDTVLVPRIKKVTFTPEWKIGKPKRPISPEEAARSPRIVKIVRLESYEDALNNLDTLRTETQQLLLDAPEAKGVDGLREQYMLRYMLNVETRNSQSLLNVQAFTDPTAYRLKVKRPGSDEVREVNADLLETFNWLIGLTVRNIAAPQTFSATFERDSEKRLRLKDRLKLDAEGRFWFRTVTGTTPDGRRTLVIWRKLSDKQEEDNLVLEEWFTRQGYSSRDSEFDLIYVNGGNNLENLKASDDLWKVRLIEEDFHRLMFDVEGE